MKTLTLSLSLIFAAPALAVSQDAAKAESGEGAAIAWYGTWEQGAAEAKRLGLPIFLHSAAPRCGGVPGMW
jgi:hypothetical protein